MLVFFGFFFFKGEAVLSKIEQLKWAMFVAEAIMVIWCSLRIDVRSEMWKKYTKVFIYPIPLYACRMWYKVNF